MREGWQTNSNPYSRGQTPPFIGALTTLLLHKPYGVLSQFTPEPGSRWGTLAEIIATPGVYATGRLDADSEGLLILTSNGRLQARLSQPRWGHWRTYHVQVEGEATEAQCDQLGRGVCIQNHKTRVARVQTLSAPPWPPRVPPIRSRLSIPTSWLELSLQEGRNRQVRRMTAAVGLPTLRLIRVAIDLQDGGPALSLAGLAPGEWRPVDPREQQRLAKLLG
jgi:23S rRNA pseudouridine2457 synthase